MFAILKKLFSDVKKVEQPIHTRIDNAVSKLIDTVGEELSHAKQELSQVDDAIAALMSRRATLAFNLEAAKEKHAALHLVTGKQYEDVK